MRILLAGIAALGILLGNTTFAQESAGERKVAENQEVPTNMSPEMWAYLQEMRRQDDPKLNARRAAQFKAEQRRLRLASQQWYGYSNLRPIANPMPIMGSYSPSWAGNSSSATLWYPAYYPSTTFVGQRMIYAR
jgi:hypothetical protein